MQKARAVSPHDTNPLPDGVCSGLICSGAGNVNICLVDDDVATQAFVVALSANTPSLLGFRIKWVKSTSTTATGIKALYTN